MPEPYRVDIHTIGVTGRYWWDLHYDDPSFDVSGDSDSLQQAYADSWGAIKAQFDRSPEE